MCKIDGCLQESFQLSPAGESNIVVRGDALKGNAMEQSGKRGTNSVAFSVGQFDYPCSFGLEVHSHQKHPRTVFGNDEIKLNVS